MTSAAPRAPGGAVLALAILAAVGVAAFAASPAGAQDSGSAGASEPTWSELLDPAAAVRRLLELRFGRAIEFEQVSWQASPPRILVGSLRVAGEKPGDPPALVAAKARLPVDPASLLDGVLVVDPLQSESARWTLRDGIVLDLRNLSIRLEARAQDQPVLFRGSAELASGGRLRIDGSGRVGGRLDARLALEDVDLSPVARAMPRVARLSGLANGEIRFAGEPERPESFGADIALRDTDLQLEDIALERSISVRAELRELVGEEARGRARFDVDASLAELTYGGGVYHKAVGEPATVVGELVRDPDGQWRLVEARLKVGPKAASPGR